MTSALDGQKGRASSPSSSSSSPTPARGNSTGFIRPSCGATLYSRLCYVSLAAYADSVAESSVTLARLVANVTAALLHALSARVAALRRRRASPREAAALRDCCEYVADLPAAPGLSSRASSPTPSSTPTTPRGEGGGERVSGLEEGDGERSSCG